MAERQPVGPSGHAFRTSRTAALGVSHGQHRLGSAPAARRLSQLQRASTENSSRWWTAGRPSHARRNGLGDEAALTSGAIAFYPLSLFLSLSLSLSLSLGSTAQKRRVQPPARRPVAARRRLDEPRRPPRATPAPALESRADGRVLRCASSPPSRRSLSRLRWPQVPPRRRRQDRSRRRSRIARPPRSCSASGNPRRFDKTTGALINTSPAPGTAMHLPVRSRGRSAQLLSIPGCCASAARSSCGSTTGSSSRSWRRLITRSR